MHPTHAPADPEVPDCGQEIVGALAHLSGLAVRPRASEIFDRLAARDLLAACKRPPSRTRRWPQFDGFLAGLPAGVQLFSLFEANPQLIDLIVDIAATAPALAHYLSRNAGVFDAVIGGDFFARLAGAARRC